MPIEHQIGRRIPTLSHLFPGLTDRRIGRLSHTQWVTVRDACDQWLKGDSDG